MSNVTPCASGAGDAAHIGLPGIRAGLAAAARLLLAPEGAADLGAGGADVDIGNAAVRSDGGDELFHLAHVGGEDRRRQPLAHAIMQRDRLIEAGIFHHIKDRRKGLFRHRPGLAWHFDQRRTDVTGRRAFGDIDAFAAGNCSTMLSCLGEGRLHLAERRLIDQRPDQHRRLSKRIADHQVRVNLLQLRDQCIMDVFIHDQSPQRGAALAGGADCREGDGAEREREIGGGTDDRGIVAAEFEDRARKPPCKPRTDLTTHRRRARRRDERDARIVDETFSDLAAADQHGREVRRRFGKLCRDTLHQRLYRERTKRGLFRGFPDHRIAAHQRERGVPGPDRHREVERRDDADGTQRMPLLHHPVAGPLAGDGETVELARQADREVADVDHLLNLTASLGEDLAGLDGDEFAERVLCRAQFLAEQADELAAARRGSRAP